MVVAICLLEILSWLLYIIIFVLSFFSKYSVLSGYFVPFILFIQYSLLIWMIPLNLNWSKHSYRRLLGKSIMFIAITILSFSIIYWFRGVTNSATNMLSKNYEDCLYFSITTWSTLGYGDFKPISSIKLLTSLEAILGVISMPLMFSMIWQYCNFRLWKVSEDEKTDVEKIFELDERGVWKRCDRNNNIIDIEQRYHLNNCKKCGSDSLKVEQYFEIMGIVSPKMLFMVHCKCGNFTHNKFTAMSAAKTWNKKNKK